MKHYHLWVLFLIPLVFSGCSGCANSTKTNRKVVDYKLAGFVGAKNFAFADVRLLTVNAKGQRGSLNSATLTNSGGYFRAQLKKANIGKSMIVLVKKTKNSKFRCELVSGCYNKVAYKGELKIDDKFELSAVVGGAQDNMIINANWLTHLASAYAYTIYITDNADLNTTKTPKSGVYTPYTIELANKQVSQIFGFGDIISMPITSPSNLAELGGSSKQQKIDSIVAGAILASMQSLAKARNETIDVWLNKMVDGFLKNKGQMYQKGGTSHASLFEIYQAAESLLVANRNYQKTLKKVIPLEVNDAITHLQQRRSGLEDGKLTKVKATSSYTKFVDAMTSSKAFLKDLNEQIINFYGQDPTKKSFVDRAYAQTVEAHYDAIKEAYRVHLAQGVNADFDTLQKLVAYFASCIAGTCDATSSVHSNSAYNGANKTLRYNNSFNMTYVVKPRNKGDKTSQIFDFTTLGSLSKVTLGDGSYVRIRYDASLPNVGKIGESESNIQPVGFEFVWPDIRVPKADGNLMKFSFKGKLLGVKDGLNSSSKYRYNITEVDFYSNIGKGLIGSEATINDKNYNNITGIKFSAKTSGGGSYYPESYWPKFSGFFDENSKALNNPNLKGLFVSNSATGFIKGSIERDLFKYLQGTEISAYSETNKTVKYLDFWIKNQGANRTRIYTYPDGNTKYKGYYSLQTCELAPPSGGTIDSPLKDWKVKTQITKDPNNSSKNITTELCGEFTNKKAPISDSTKKPELPTFIKFHQDGAFKAFSINGRGAYEPQYGIFAPTSDAKAVDGKLTGPFVMGIENLKLQLEHKLKDKPNAIVKFDLTQRVRDIWEAAVSFGYDYEYLIGVVPTGLKTKSLYLAYQIKKKLDSNSNPLRVELGSLLIFNGKNAIAGKDSIAVQLASDVNFSEGQTHRSCGLHQHGKLISKDDCTAIAYLTYRGALMATVREERPGVYVARYLDGSFIILGE